MGNEKIPGSMEILNSMQITAGAANPELSDGEVTVNLHIDVEPQRDGRPGYAVEKRGIYYLARELCSQLSLAKENTDYGCLEKCYSIWVCRDHIPKDERFSISFIEMSNTINEKIH